MSDIWAHAFAYTLQNEGATYVTDPSPTLRGITLETLAGFRGKPCTAADVRALTLSETQQIYRTLYWAKICGDDLVSEPVATAFFDAAVNTGVSTAAKKVQNIVGAVPDGNIGPKSVAAINALTPALLVVSLSAAQQAYYISLVRADPSRRQYLATWLKRAALYQALIA